MDTTSRTRQVTRRDVVRGAGVGVGALLLEGGLGLRPAVAGPRPGRRADDHAADTVQGWVGALYVSQRDARALPPSAARLYGLAMLAGHEAVVDGMPGQRSLGRRLNDLGRSPVRRAKGIHWGIAANAAIREVAVGQSFDRTQAVRDALAAHGDATHAALAAGQPAGVVDAALAHGRAVAAWLNGWADGDGYAATRDLPYTPPTGPGLWERTPPNNGAAIEPHWAQVRPLALRVRRTRDGRIIDPAAPPPPVAYDPSPGSAFGAQAQAVLDAAAGLTDAQRETAMYWRDNPDGVTGLPSGHWLQIGADVTGDLGHGLGTATWVLAVLGITVADAFTSCWIEKYRSNVLRPVTWIRAHVPSHEQWLPYVNSPAFPEYTSGHSVSSGAAASVLAALVGERSFTDRQAEGRVVAGNDRMWTLRARTFPSFAAAAEEAAVSRLYGGIHFPMAIEHGLTQGHRVADLVLDRVVRGDGDD